MVLYVLVKKPLWFAGLAMIGLSLMLGSCANTRPYTYMQGSFDTAKLSQIVIKEPIIQKGDILGITVYSDNPAGTAFYNPGGSNAAASAASPSGSAGGATSAGTAQVGVATPSYLVDENGNIEFQSLGILHVDGLTRGQLKELLNSKLKEVLNNPYYSIRFLNYKFTMIGEVTKPGVISIPGEHINLLEALGLAGDLTFYARRDNILLIRENNGKREWGRMDITKPEIMASPYFNIQPNDIVIVDATRKKIAANDQSLLRTLSITTSLISVFAIIYSIFR